MRIFITGAYGQAGQEIVGLFSEHELYLASHKKDNITDNQIIETIIKFKPEVVIHTAAMTNVDDCTLHPEKALEVNELGSQHVATGAAESGAVIVALSTDYVFSGAKQTPYEETEQPNPINTYGQSKLAGERIIQSTTPRCFIIRTSWVFGKNGGNFVHSVLAWAQKQNVLKFVNDKTGSPTYVKDLALAIQHLLKTESYGTYHVSGEGACTWEEYGQEILKVMNIQKPITPISFQELHLPAARPSYSVLNNTKLKKRGLTMRPWKIALRDYLLNEYKSPQDHLTE